MFLPFSVCLLCSHACAVVDGSDVRRSFARLASCEIACARRFSLCCCSNPDLTTLVRVRLSVSNHIMCTMHPRLQRHAAQQKSAAKRAFDARETRVRRSIDVQISFFSGFRPEFEFCACADFGDDCRSSHACRAVADMWKRSVAEA